MTLTRPVTTMRKKHRPSIEPVKLLSSHHTTRGTRLTLEVFLPSGFHPVKLGEVLHAVADLVRRALS